MKKHMQFMIISADKVSVAAWKRLLIRAGHKVVTCASAARAMQAIIDLKPDCILCETDAKEINGFELFKKIRQDTRIKKQAAFIITSNESFVQDQKHALKVGMDGCLHKSIDTTNFIDDLLDLLNNNIIIKFWGVRGTLPVPGKKSVKYGGNTNCITLNIGKKHLFIFDAGTGIRELSDYLVKKNQFPLSAKIFLTHPHYDHINGIPFFVPIYKHGNHFEFIGTNHEYISLERLVADQMDGVYFPVTTEEFGATVTYREVNEDPFNIDNIQIDTILLNHPGRCLGYKVTYKNKSFCYITDNEIYFEDSSFYKQADIDRLIEFIYGTDILVMDATYHDEEYHQKVGWGHSAISRVIDIADKAKVKLLCLHHHDPGQTDADIDAKLRKALSLLRKRRSKIRCIAPKEGMQIII